jgi:hypothetical protein
MVKQAGIIISIGLQGRIINIYFPTNVTVSTESRIKGYLCNSAGELLL